MLEIFLFNTKGVKNVWLQSTSHDKAWEREYRHPPFDTELKMDSSLSLIVVILISWQQCDNNVWSSLAAVGMTFLAIGYLYVIIPLLLQPHSSLPHRLLFPFTVMFWHQLLFTLIVSSFKRPVFGRCLGMSYTYK